MKTNTNTKLNIASIIGVKDGVDQIFSLINEYLESYSQNSEETIALESCRSYIHQLNGLLEMLELDNVTIICSKMEALINGLIEKKIHPELEAIKALKQTIDVLLRYLHDLIDGVDSNPVRLFPAYRDIMLAQGVKEVSESDLFCANLAYEPVLQECLPNSGSTEIKATAKQAQSEYQTGLLKWLRHPNNHDAIEEMINAVRLIEKFPGSMEQRASWWACTGFLESLMTKKTPIELSIRRLCGKIEQEIRRLSEEKPATTNKLMQEVLYHIAHSEFDSERIREIKHTYKLQDQPAPVDEQTNAQQIEEEIIRESTLSTMLEILEEINECWRQFSTGELENQTSLLNNIEKLKTSAAKLKFSPLEKFVGVVSGSITFFRIRPKDMNDNVAVEIATALLFIKNIITDFHQLPSEFPKQTEALSKRLRMITTGKQKNNDLPDIPGPNDIEYKSQEQESRLQVSQEILTNLAQIEGIFDQFFIDPTIRSDLSKLPSLFKQTAGALTMLKLGPANLLLNQCEELLNTCIQPEHEISVSEQVQLADGLCSLGFYIEGLTSARPDNDAIIDSALILFNDTPPSLTTDKAISDNLSGPPLMGTPIIEEPTGKIEPDLLEIFLIESDGVLHEIKQNLATLQKDSANDAPLTNIRRGFHTMKGSGRMVELHDFSEVAWRIEDILNQWLSERKPITEQLTNLLTHAHHEFEQWCQDLKKNGKTEINTEELILLTNNIVRDTAPASTAEIETMTAPIDQNTKSNTNNDVTIGEIVIARDLYEVFVSEAGQHIVTLENELNNCDRPHNFTLNEKFMRAAHTLSSSSHALGLTFISGLASSLEKWSSQRLNNPDQKDEAGWQCAQTITKHLDNFLGNVNNQKLPQKTDLQAANTLSQKLALLVTQEKQDTDEKPSDHESPKVIEPVATSKLSSDQHTTLPNTHENKYPDSVEKLDTTLSQIFFDEAGELIPEIGKILRTWRTLPQDDSTHKTLLRALHTLKGSARMPGAIQLGEMIHNLESGVERVISENTFSASMIDSLEIEFDAISEYIDRLQHTTNAEKPQHSLASFLSQPAGETSVSQTTHDNAKFTGQKTVLRVNEELVDRILNESGEISIIRSKVESQLFNFKQSLLDLAESAERLREQLREVEIQAESQMQSHLVQPQEDEQPFDPLEFDRFTRFQELTRLMAESVDDVATVQQNLQDTHNSAKEAITQQALMSRQLQQVLVQIRTVPFGNFAEYFYRIVRQAARDLNKKVNLSIQGDEIEVDRSILDKINSPIDHLLRNAVAHGIEEPAKRSMQGKPETGQVTINLRQEGNEIIITLSDDGCGLDLAQIREKAIQMELINANDKVNDEQLMSLIFSHGLTTLKEATDTAGRGIGMDVVKNEITTLGGHIEIQSETNKGTIFRIVLPLTLTIAQTLLIRAGENTYAVPTILVKHVKELNTDELNAAYNSRTIEFNDENFSFTYLLHLFGEPNRVPEIKRHNRVLLLQSETCQLAVHVDELIGNNEVIVKNIGPQMANAPGVEGATVMGDGEIILMINPIKLMQRTEVKSLLSSPLPPTPKVASVEKYIPTIMIVDDSLTVRKVTSRLLEREGYEILNAKDGVGAINLLRERRPDVMLVDLEMPHMNGFELIRNVRNNPETTEIPIIIISSRTADKHRKMANELGVNIFLSKPYNEEELLTNITQFI